MRYEKQWYSVLTPEGRFIRWDLLTKTQAHKWNRCYRRLKIPYKWVLYSDYIHEVEIGKLATA